MWRLHAVVVFLLALAATQSPDMIAGRVVELPSRVPVADAVVTVMTSGTGEAVSTVTDDDGRFGFQHVTGDRVILSATHAGFLKSAYGERFPGDAGLPVSPRDANAVNVEIGLLRGGVITGQVTDDKGRPVADARVSLGDGTAADPIKTVTTDDRGLYRVPGLGAGAYWLEAQQGESQSRTPRQASQMIDELLTWLAHGNRSARGGPTDPASANGRPQPDPTIDLAEESGGEWVTASAGTETRSDVQLSSFRPSSIQGTVAGLQPGEAANVLLFEKRPSAISLRPGPVAETVVDGTGHFVLAHLRPGQYVLLARGLLRDHTSGRDYVAGWAEDAYALGAGQIVDAALSLSAPIEIAGTVLVEGSTTKRPSLKIVLTPNGDVLPRDMPTTGVVDSRGHFKIRVIPGPYIASAENEPQAATAWGVSHVTLSDGQTADELLNLQHSEVSLKLSVASTGATVYGALGPSGLRLPDYEVIIFSADSRFWFVNSPRVFARRVGSDGSFRCEGMHPGSYLIAVVSTLTPSNLYLADALSKLEPSAVRVSVEAGQTLREDLTLVGK